MYNDELMHAATRIMANRAEQLGISEDELMHYGRKGMKWGENIFENTINNPNINPFKKRELEKKKEELLTRPVRIERGAQVRGDTGTSQDMSGYDRALGEGKKVFVGNDYLDGKPVKDNYLQKADPEPGTRINYRYDYTSENHKSPDDRAKQNTNIQKYGNTVNSYQAPTAEDTARGQAVREEQKRAHQENEMNEGRADKMDKEEMLRPVREGKTEYVLDNADYGDSGIYPVQVVPRSGIAYAKEYYDRPDYEISAQTVYRGGRNSEVRDDLKKIRDNTLTQAENRAKYGKTQPELNDEEEIAKKARGQYIRDEQKRARQEELNKKKQELLNKAKEERIMRERYANRAKYTK